ncbi:hypothetical protein K493DRAFT_60962 [Basidiobolus meristosporus CBS 931.73]|uniref:Uncharacterized protein n=1 Tax=Basidiobolus meristosporus CBS 931.73 TaxID=1314790 RepID=A0A1Y1Z1D3_9FUNG|nr:hypothetical protein K493DRAFT_60962 [Basidiobolus meristosporus CBS 931.73]|eukprot:ORY04101.1 hypothetical protein K493DRAFT_60962 [Basidiobolus meristosporus CBS 931.73]
MTSPLTRDGCEVLRQQALERLEDLTENGAGQRASNEPATNIRLQVMRLLRYTIDVRARSFFENVAQIEDSVVDIFDMVVSDAAHKLKVVLSPELNYLIYQGLICEKAVIEIQDCTLRFRETDLSATEIIILTKVNILDYQVSKYYKKKGREDIKYLVEASNEFLPLTSRRCSYLTPLGDDDFLRDDHRWVKQDLSMNNDFRLDHAGVSLADILKGLEKSYTYRPPIVGRIMKKSTVAYYGKPEDVKASYPFQFTISIADDTASVSVVFWNSSCLKYYQSLAVNQIVQITGYKVRRAYEGNASKIELSINPKNPTGVIESLQDNNFEGWSQEEIFSRYPLQIPNILSFSTLPQLPDEAEVDIVGCVVYVGRLEAEKRTPHGYSEFRWIKLLDRTENQEVILKMYACSQLKALQRVEVGSVLLCTHAHISSITLNSVTPRTTYATSSWYSEYKLIKPGKPLPPHLDQYAPRISAKLVHNFASSGGYFSLPTPFSTVRDLQLFDADFELTPFNEVETFFDRLAQRERIQIVCQGFVHGIHLRPNKRRHEGETMDPNIPEFSDKLPVSYATKYFNRYRGPYRRGADY